MERRPGRRRRTNPTASGRRPLRRDERRRPHPASLAALGLLLRHRAVGASGNMTTVADGAGFDGRSVRGLRPGTPAVPSIAVARLGGADSAAPDGRGPGGLRSARRRAQEVGDESPGCHPAGRWHSSMTRPGRCTNDDVLPASWLAEPMSSFFTFGTPDECCAQDAFAGRPCGVDDCRDGGGGGGESDPTGITYPPSHRCRGRMWHPDLTSPTPACTNTVTDYPGEWDGPLMVGVTMFAASSDCCDTLWGDWKNKKEEKRMRCRAVEAAECSDPDPPGTDAGGGGPAVPTPGAPTGGPPDGECDHPWHPSRDGRGCSNGPPGTYPREWEGRFEYGSHGECCGRYHGYSFDDLGECTRLDYCSRGPAAREQPGEGQTTTTTAAATTTTAATAASSPAAPSGPVFGDGSGSGLEAEGPMCGAWTRRKQCSRRPGCAWDYASETCEEDGGGDAGPVDDSATEGCASSPNKKQCTKRPGCAWDLTSGTCGEDGGADAGSGPADGPAPVPCGSLVSKKRCTRSPLCGWDLALGVCAEADPPSPPGSLGGDVPVPPSWCDASAPPPPYHPTTPGERTCTNGPGVPDTMAGASGFSFVTPEGCCASFYPDGPCDVVDVCSDAAAAAGECASISSAKKCKKDGRCGWDDALGACGDA